MSGRRYGNVMTVALVALLLSVFGLCACTTIQLPESQVGNGRVLLLLRESTGKSEEQTMITDDAIMLSRSYAGSDKLSRIGMSARRESRVSAA